MDNRGTSQWAFFLSLKSSLIDLEALITEAVCGVPHCVYCCSWHRGGDSADAI